MSKERSLIMPAVVPPPEEGKTSVRFGPAFLRPAEEKDHYELMRPILTAATSDGKTTKMQHTQPIGPLAIYRVKSKGDNPLLMGGFGPPAEMKTIDQFGKPLALILVWHPQMSGDYDKDE